MSEKVDTEGRDYTRQVYQNLMAVAELLDKKSPLPVSQKQIQKDLNLSKSIAFDICWNLCKRDWAEDMGSGMVRMRSKTTHLESAIGKEVMKVIEDVCGVVLGGEQKE